MDSPSYFVVKTMAKPSLFEDDNRFFCIDQRKIWRYTGTTTIPALRGRLLDERQSATDLWSQTAHDEGDADEGLPALEDPMLIIDEWEELRLLLANGRQEADNELVLVMYGLFQDSLGTRHTTAQPTIEDVRNRAMEAWQEFFRPGTVAYLHLVRPQRNLIGREIQLIIEFSNRFFDVPVLDIPVVRKIYWEGVWTEAEPVAAYHTQGISTFQLLVQSGLMEWCGPDTRTECNIHIEGQITAPLVPIELNKGSMLEVFIHFGEVESDAVTLVQSRSHALSPRPQILGGGIPAPREHADAEGSQPNIVHGQGHAASSNSGNGSSEEFDAPSNPGSEDETSGSDFDPDHYGWDDELPHGLVKVACFKRGPSHESDPILAIVSMRREEDLHDQLATLYRMPARFVKGILFVAPSPDFAEEHGAWPIIVERTQDRHDPTTQKIVVLQVDYYYSQANAGDQATQWRVVILPNVASRMEVIAATDALNYCEALADSRCLVWHRRELWSQQGPEHIISDGDLIRVAIPPIDEGMCESTWIRVQDTYDAGRLVGLPPGSSDEEPELTPRSSITGLRSSSVSDASDWGNDMQDQFGPDLLPQHAADASLSSVGSTAEFTQNPSSVSAVHLSANLHSQAIPGASKLYPEEDWTIELGSVQTGYSIVLYGLYWEDVGTRFAQVSHLSLLLLEEAVHQQWPQFVHYQKNLFRIDPQPNGGDRSEVHVLVEFLNSADYPHPALEPVLEILHLSNRDGTLEEIRQPVYHHSYLNLRQALHGLGTWCDHDRNYYCEVWIKGQPLRDEEQSRLHPGDLITMRLSPKTQSMTTRSTSLLQQGSVLGRKFTIPLEHYICPAETSQQRSVSLPIEPAQLCNFIAAWRDAPLGSINGLSDGIELPTATSDALAKAEAGQKGMKAVTHIFTDGSFDSNSEIMAWSFVVLQTDQSDYSATNTFQLLGYACGIVETSPESPHWKGANQRNAYVAEVEALLQSHWWALAHDVGPEVHFHYDAKSAGNGVNGQWGYDATHQLCGLARAIAQCLEICVGGPVLYHHIRAHSGDPWNELVDAVANGCRAGRISPTRPPDFDLRPWIQGNYVLPAEHLPLALQVLQGHPGLPTGTVNSLTYAANLGTPFSSAALWYMDLDQQQGAATSQHQIATGSDAALTMYAP